MFSFLKKVAIAAVKVVDTVVSVIRNALVFPFIPIINKVVK